MSDPSVSSPAAGVANVTDSDSAHVTPVRAIRFTPEFLDMFVDILDEEETDRVTLRQGLEFLLNDHWRVRKWGDLKFFTSADVKTALVPGNGMPEELLTPVIVKKIGCLVDYAQVGTLRPGMTMDDVVGLLPTLSTKLYSGGIGSPSRRGTTVQVYDKKSLPTLDKFSGLDEDYFAWKETTVNSMGIHGFGRFLSDASATTKHPDIAESVFYSLRAAVHGGQAQSIAQAMLDENRLDPVELWSALAAYYDTALNRANVVLFDVRRLLSIRLDPDVSGSKFVSDFRDCLQRLRKNNARLAEDSDTLRALLLVAIQDDAFEMVRDSIVHKPGMSVETILTEIRERETSLYMKDQASGVSGDGTATRFSRRTAQSSTSSQQRSSTESSSSQLGSRKWNIPKYPDNWRSAFGTSLYKLLMEWRVEAHKGKSQLQLNERFNTFVESYQAPASSGGKKKKSKSRRAKKASGTDSSAAGTTVNTDSGNEEGSESQGDDTVTRKRIRLQKSRRVITERNA